MPTKAQLEQRIKELENQINADDSTLTIGRKYNLNMGQFTVTAFYTEDGVNKVQGHLQQWDTKDITIPVGEPILCSMPIPLAYERMEDYEKTLRGIK